MNAIRTSHNPFDPLAYDLFDRMGFLVLDEFFDVWTGHKYSQPGDYATYFNTWHTTDLTDIVKQHRNHPSIVFYSIGNEIRDALATRTPLATAMVSLCHTLDPTRPVTQALFQPANNNDYPGNTLNVLDVFGVNYRNLELAAAIALTPHHSGVQTEKGTSPGEWASIYLANPQIVGEFLWTGPDYLGEANGLWPQIGGTSGIIDRVSTIKDMGYQYQAIWSSNPVSRPTTTTTGATRVVLSVDHPTISTNGNDVAYVKATVMNAAGAIVTSASNAVTFSLTGTTGKIIALDSGNPNQESYRGTSRNAYQGICFAIVRMTSAGTVTITASATGLTGSSVTVTGNNAPFVPCSGNCD